MGLSRRERREQRKKFLKEQRLQQLRTLEEHEKRVEKKKYNTFLRFYDKHYLTLLIIPVLIFLISAGCIAYQVATTGDFLHRGVSLKGGMVITIPVQNPVSIDEVDKILRASFPKDDLEVRSVDELGNQIAIIITTDNLNSEGEILNLTTPLIPNAHQQASVETTGSSLGSGFFTQTMYAVIIAFVCMSIVVFISFKNFAPSMMVISCAFVDILEPLALVDVLGIRISTAGIAAFLMLIGYSVDTDILLTSRVLKNKEGTVFDRTISAAKTGLLMTLTTLVAVTIGFFMTQSSTIKEIMTIMIFGLIFDIINTWIQNVALLRYYIEHIKGRKAEKPRPVAVTEDTEEELLGEKADDEDKTIADEGEQEGLDEETSISDESESEGDAGEESGEEVNKK